MKIDALKFTRENFELLKAEHKKLIIRYNEQGMAMSETADMIRSLYTGPSALRWMSIAQKLAGALRCETFIRRDLQSIALAEFDEAIKKGGIK